MLTRPTERRKRPSARIVRLPRSHEAAKKLDYKVLPIHIEELPVATTKYWIHESSNEISNESSNESSNKFTDVL
jgi:hypothetical protein